MKTTVNLKALTDLFREVATELSWCNAAEEYFEKSTGVTPLEWKPSGVRSCSCGCGMPVGANYLTEARFLLPGDAPEEVPAEPILAEMQAYAKRLGGGCGCSDCSGYVEEQVTALRRLAELLPGKPSISA